MNQARELIEGEGRTNHNKRKHTQSVTRFYLLEFGSNEHIYLLRCPKDEVAFNPLKRLQQSSLSPLYLEMGDHSLHKALHNLGASY
jgi:hypothetical protein